MREVRAVFRRVSGQAMVISYPDVKIGCSGRAIDYVDIQAVHGYLGVGVLAVRRAGGHYYGQVEL